MLGFSLVSEYSVVVAVGKSKIEKNEGTCSRAIISDKIEHLIERRNFKMLTQELCTCRCVKLQGICHAGTNKKSVHFSIMKQSQMFVRRSAPLITTVISIE